MNYLDREGIFKARPLDWRVVLNDTSRSVAIEIDFVVLAQLDGTEWSDWANYDEVRVRGRYFVVKKDGTPNLKTCEQLAASMGWGGGLAEVARQAPPECIVQVAVKAETYEGKTYYRAGWMNPGDYVPQTEGASQQELEALDARFGSLLRAATAGAKKAATVKPGTPKPAPPPASRPPTELRKDLRDAANTDPIPF